MIRVGPDVWLSPNLVAGVKIERDIHRPREWGACFRVFAITNGGAKIWVSSHAPDDDLPLEPLRDSTRELADARRAASRIAELVAAGRTDGER